MKSVAQKILITFGFITLITLSVIPVSVMAQEGPQGTPSTQADTKLPSTNLSVSGVVGGAISGLFDIQGAFLRVPLFFIMKIAAALLGMAGLLLDEVMVRTVVNMSKEIEKVTAINDVWRIIRDLVNMSFIFILLYHGIRMVLGLGDAGVKKIIAGIITTAILINFSLLFTKVIIDASNVVTLGFYNSISAAGGTAEGGEFAGKYNFGFSGAFMKPLGITGAFDPSGFSQATNFTFGENGNMVIIYLGSIVFMLITIFIFMAVSVFFIIRFVAFIILLIMSPVAFLFIALPGLDNLKSKYWGTLSGQALFGPLYMFYSWLVLRLMGPGGLGSSDYTLGYALMNPNKDTISVIINFIILIGLLVTSVIEAKKQATSGGIISTKILDKGTGYLGSAIFGGASMLGRSTLGRWGQSVTEDRDLKERASRGDIGARLKLSAGNRLASSSFDARNTKVMELASKDVTGLGTIANFGKAINTKGYRGYVEDTLKAQIEKDKKRADQFKVPEDKQSLAEYEKSIQNDPSIETNKRDSRKLILNTLIEEEQDKVKSEVKKVKEVIDKLTEGKEKFEAEKRKVEEDIQRSHEMILMASQTGDSATVEIYTANLQKEEAQLKTLTDALTDASTILQEKKEELNKINKDVLALQLEAKEIENGTWISPEYEKIIADAGGRSENKAERKKAVASTSAKNILAYAERVKRKTGLFSGLPNFRIDRNFSKKRADAVRKLTKEETDDAKMLKLIKKMAEDEKKQAEKDAQTNKPADPAQNPPTPTPPPPSTP